jgi:hypothetical protein
MIESANFKLALDDAVNIRYMFGIAPRFSSSDSSALRPADNRLPKIAQNFPFGARIFRESFKNGGKTPYIRGVG